MDPTILVLLEINVFIRPEIRNLCISASLILSKKTKWNDYKVIGGSTAVVIALHSAEMLTTVAPVLAHISRIFYFYFFPCPHVLFSVVRDTIFTAFSILLKDLSEIFSTKS